MVWFLEPVFASVESYRADWHAACGEIADSPVKLEVRSVDMSDMGNFAFL